MQPPIEADKDPTRLKGVLWVALLFTTGGWILDLRETTLAPLFAVILIATLRELRRVDTLPNLPAERVRCAICLLMATLSLGFVPLSHWTYHLALLATLCVLLSVLAGLELWSWAKGRSTAQG